MVKPKYCIGGVGDALNCCGKVVKDAKVLGMWCDPIEMRRVHASVVRSVGEGLELPIIVFYKP